MTATSAVLSSQHATAQARGYGLWQPHVDGAV